MTLERILGTKTGAGGQALPFSQAVRAGDFVFVSGQVAMDDRGEVVQGGIEAQTRRTIEHLRRILEAAGCTLADVVKVGVWLEDPRDFWSFNRIYTEFFGDHPPARSTVESRMMVDCKVEMDCIAYKPKS